MWSKQWDPGSLHRMESLSLGWLSWGLPWVPFYSRAWQISHVTLTQGRAVEQGKYLPGTGQAPQSSTEVANWGIEHTSSVWLTFCLVIPALPCWESRTQLRTNATGWGKEKEEWAHRGELRRKGILLPFPYSGCFVYLRMFPPVWTAGLSSIRTQPSDA